MTIRGWRAVLLFTLTMILSAVTVFFHDQGVSYMGLELDLEGKKHYGWLLMDFSFAPDSGCYFKGYAYETEFGVAIKTGEIPEPSTYTLWVGILSALAVVILKRFRILKWKLGDGCLNRILSVVAFEGEVFSGAEVFFDVFMSGKFDPFFEDWALEPVNEFG